MASSQQLLWLCSQGHGACRVNSNESPPFSGLLSVQDGWHKHPLCCLLPPASVPPYLGRSTSIEASLHMKYGVFLVLNRAACSVHS